MELNEDITAGSTIVYHRTGDHDKYMNLEYSVNGFRKGNVLFYGEGIYASLNEADMNKPELIKRYGQVLVECKVLSLKGFLIIDQEVTRRVYGKEISVTDQIARIMGTTPQAMQADPALGKELQSLDEVTKEMGIAQGGQSLRYVCPEIYSNLNGIVTNDPEEGKILIAFDAQNVVPQRYKSGPNGEWKNVVNKDFYQKVYQFLSNKSQNQDSPLAQKMVDNPNKTELEVYFNRMNTKQKVNYLQHIAQSGDITSTMQLNLIYDEEMLLAYLRAVPADKTPSYARAMMRLLKFNPQSQGQTAEV